LREIVCVEEILPFPLAYEGNQLSRHSEKVLQSDMYLWIALRRFEAAARS
jgi:hypothetical protein